MPSIMLANFADKQHAAALVEILDIYASDSIGGSTGLSDFAKQNLASEIHQRDHMFSMLAFDGNKPIGLANCIEGFSSFACRPLVNIHDLVVIPQYRGKGVGHKLLLAVEREAQLRGCCKITLEVLDGNTVAKTLYRKFGFGPYCLDPRTGQAFFWEKPLA